MENTDIAHGFLEFGCLGSKNICYIIRERGKSKNPNLKSGPINVAGQGDISINSNLIGDNVN